MPRKTRRSSSSAAVRPAASGVPWPLLVVTGLLCAGLGFGAAALTLHRAPTPAPAFAPTGVLAVRVGDYYSDSQDWPHAITYYEQAIRSGQDNPDVRTDLGSAYRFAGKPSQALAEYQTAQKQNPGHENSLFNQGGVYALDLHQPDQARTVWQDYLTRFPKGQHVTDAKRLLLSLGSSRAK